MAKRIDLSFSTDPDRPPPPECESSGDSNEDTAVPNAGEPCENMAAMLEHLRIGQQTVAEMVKGLEAVLGHQLYPSGIVQGRGTTRVFLEKRPPLNNDPSIQTIYDITDGGEVDTNMVRIPGSKNHRVQDSMFVKFQTKFIKPPSVIVGLNYLDIGSAGILRIHAYTDRIHDHLFEVRNNSWANTIVNGVGYTWLAIPSSKHPLLQTGSYYTYDDHPWNVKKALTHAAITFPSPYKSPPKVIVWLRRLDFHDNHGQRVMAFATDITPTGFKIHINTWDDTFLYTAGISWFAYPADTPGICSGDLQPSKGTVGIVTFDKPFARTPRRILVALNKLHADHKFNCRIKVIHEAVSERGMAVRVETWDDSALHTAGVAYIAME